MITTTVQTSAVAIDSRVRWGRVVGIAFALEAVLFAVLVPIQRLLGLTVWFAVVAIGCFVFGYAAGRWVARGVTSRLALHGFLVGAVATLIYLGDMRAGARRNPGASRDVRHAAVHSEQRAADCRLCPRRSASGAREPRVGGSCRRG